MNDNSRDDPRSTRGVRIRERVASDLPRCVDTLREVHLADGYPDTWPEDPLEWLLPDASAWVAVEGGSVVGHVAVVGHDSGLWVSRLFVGSGARGLRVGESLLSQARHAGAVMLDVVERSVNAIELYERLGWTLIDSRPAGWIMADGTRPIERVYAWDPSIN